MLAILYSVHDYNRNNMHDHVGGNMETTILVSYSTKIFIMCFKWTKIKKLYTDSRPNDIKPNDSKPNDINPNDIKPNNINPNDIKPNATLSRTTSGRLQH